MSSGYNENRQSNMSKSTQNEVSRSSFASSDVNEISVDTDQATSPSDLKYLPHWPPANIEFQDLTLSVPELTTGRKVLLRNINGKFRSNEITAIMGPSGSGKTTLLNILAGYKSTATSGQVLLNGKPRQIKTFRKMARYIMQDELLDPNFTIRETMMLCANLKLGTFLTTQQKNEVVDEILSTLLLTKSQNTRTLILSGGEKKRLSIALELVNNPPIIFLDEPTTGLDDMSGLQCIGLLKRIAHSGRTIICSIHTPSAKIFEMFDQVYVLAQGQCVYQGSGSYIVPFMQSIGLPCPLTHNPADFIIEVSSGEYGQEHPEKMVAAIDNGRYSWIPHDVEIMTNQGSTNSKDSLMEQFEEEIDPKQFKSKSTWWQQFTLLFQRMIIQMWRDKTYVRLKFFMNIILGFIVGGIYQGVGNDASKALFNFGFAFTIPIAYLYLPMMPVLLQFPTEVRLLKREYFNQWYRFSSYFLAMMLSKIPFMLILASIYLSMIYFMSNQPMELERFAMLFIVAVLVAMTSDSLAMVVASRLNIVNAMFVGPVISVPLILFSCYGFGFGKDVYVPSYMKVIIYLSYLRHGLEGLLAALYDNRGDTLCPEKEIFCIFRKSKYLLEFLGFSNHNYYLSVSALLAYYIIFTVAAFLLIKRRLSFTTSKYIAVQYIGQFVKTHLNLSSYKY